MVWQNSGIRAPKILRWQVLVLASPALATIAVAVAVYLKLSTFQMLLVGIAAALIPVCAKIGSHWTQKALENRRQIKKIAPTSKHGRLPKARNVDIPRSPRLHAANGQPIPYVSRELDPDIERHLRSANRVLVVGNSMAGKTRSLLEAMARIYPNFAVWTPSDPEQIRTAVNEGFEPRKTAILLDDLERFAAHGMTEILDGLAEENVVLASIRTVDYERFQPYGEIKPIGWDLCSWLGEPVWFHGWSPEEIDRARSHVPEEHHKVLARDGLSAFVGGGRLLANRLNALRAKNGAAYAAIKFARDWRAFSASNGFSPYVFEAMREHYQHSGEYHRQDVIDELLKPIFPGVSLASMEESQLVFSDYIDEVIEPAATTRSAAYWERVMDVADDRDLVNIGAFLMRSDEHLVELAKSSFARSKEPLAAINLAGMYAHYDPVDLDRAESLLRPHAGTMPEAALSLGIVLEKQHGGPGGANDESRQLYEFAATKEFDGAQFAQFNFASYILNDAEPDLEKAESLLRPAVDAGHDRAAAALGRVLIHTGRTEEGLEVLESVLEGNLDSSAFYYAMASADYNPARAEEVARSHCTGLELANVLLTLEGATRAREVLQILSDSDLTDEPPEEVAVINVVALLDLGECTTEMANEAVRLSWDTEERLAPLGYRLLNARFESAGLNAMRRSFELGNSRSGMLLGEYYRSVIGDLDSAEEWFVRSLDESSPSTLALYGNFLAYHRGDFEKARDLWTRTLSLPYSDQEEQQLVESVVVGNLGLLLMQAGEIDSAEALFRESLARGRVQAMWNLADLLRTRGGARNRVKALYWRWRASRRGKDRQRQSQAFTPDPELPAFAHGSELTVLREDGMTILAVSPPEEMTD